MMVKDIHTGTNISVGYENLAKTLSSNITEEQYIDALKEQLDSVSIMTVTFSDEIETVKLGKTKFTKVVCTTSVYGVSMKQVYYLNKQGSYMGIIIATVVNGYTVDEVEAMFQ